MKIGIIGGSGLYQIEHLRDVREIKIDTPFGAPSDLFISGKLNGIELFFLPRHGRNHSIMPGELNHRANIFAMKKLGITHIISISAVGSLRQEMRPRDVVIVDQYFDRTKNAGAHTFFGNGVVAHISMAEPVCAQLASIVCRAAEKAADEAGGRSDDRPRIHPAGTYINMEGPAFSTKAESNVYRAWGMDVIGMTNLAESKLAREAEIAYCTVAMVTDYDCWHDVHENVSVEMVVANLQANAKLAKALVSWVTLMHNDIPETCSCHSALSNALITPSAAVPDSRLKELEPIIGKYIKR